MLFDNLFGMMTPGLILGLLAGIVGFFTAVTAGYVVYESHDRRCLMSHDHT
jgi:hypothetical protein